MDFGPTIRGLQKGDWVFDRFLLQKVLGRGGMGVVWLAMDERLRRQVALKFAPQVVRFDEVAVEELKEETRKGLDLAHPHIVKTYDFLLDEDNAAISMEFIDGESLASLRMKQPQKIFEASGVECWVAQLLDALDYAHHHAEVIHRDLKPANLMVDQDGDLRVTDFGIARSISDALNRATIVTGDSAGTLAYMSPQQAEGRKPQISDDVYALGSTLYELLTGKPPFFSGNIALQLRQSPAKRLEERRREFGITGVAPLPPAWEEVILACLEKDPAKRPATAAEIGRRLGLGSGLEVPGALVPEVARPPQLPSSSALSPRPMPERVANEAAAAGQPGALAKAAAGSGEPAQAPEKTGMLGLWILLAMAGLGLAALGFSGWWLYENTPFFKGKGEVVKDARPPDSLSVAAVIPPPVVKPPVETLKKTPEETAEPAPPADRDREESKAVMTTQEPAPPAAVFSTIQKAMNDAKPGQTLVVPAGTYKEQLRFKAGVHLKAAEAGKVVVQADGQSGPALLAEGCRQGSVHGFVFEHTGSEVTAGEAWPVVFLKTSGISLEQCTIQNGVGDGAVITGSAAPELVKCVFRNHAGSGLVLESGSHAQVKGCEARQNGGSGMEVRLVGTAAVIAGGEVTGNAGSGIVVKDGASARVGGGMLAKSNREAGIAAAGEGVELAVETVVCEGNLFGISVQEGAFGEIQKAEVRLSEEVGLHLFNAATKSLARDNVVEKNKLDGIFATGPADAVLLIAANKLLGNGGNGIVVFGKGFLPEVTGNTCETNGQHGILAAEGVSGRLENNVLRGNHLGGIASQDADPGIIVQGNGESAAAPGTP